MSGWRTMEACTASGTEMTAADKGDGVCAVGRALEILLPVDAGPKLTIGDADENLDYLN